MKALVLIFSTLFILRGSLSAAELSGAEKLFDMSFEELLNVKVSSGNITGIEMNRAPVSVTTISHQDIALTPARNIYDLIEVYVPGAIWMNHHDSPKLGLRGIITDRNYKFLLLVDGIDVNNKARNGATTELENHDLDDIEKIEIIRGPGSVTYGPGAVAGVINIVTKSGKKYSGLSASANYDYPYNSRGINLGYMKSFKDIDISLFGSITGTKGWLNTDSYLIFNTNNTLGFGKIGQSSMGHPPQDYMADYNNIPQLKLNAEIKFMDDFKFLARYSNSGGTEYGGYWKFAPQIGYDSTGAPKTDGFQNILKSSYQQYILSLTNEHDFKDLFNLKSSVSWISQNMQRHQEYFQTVWKNEKLPDQTPVPENIIAMLEDPNSLRNKYVWYSESRLTANLLAKRSFGENLTVAAGAEFEHNIWGAPWGENESNFRMGDKGNIICGTNSNAYNFFPYSYYLGVDSADAIFVGKGWSTETFSLYGEANYTISDNFAVLLSGRLDKNSFSDYLFSPRGAIIYEINDRNTLRLIAQKSRRMNTAEELYLQHLAGKVSSPETLNSFELIFSHLHTKNLYFSASAFYNTVEVLSWYDPDRTTRKTGDLAIAGIEAELKYQGKYFVAGINHSYIKQLSWKLADGVQQSGISYSDYYYSADSVTLTGTGNDLNNWSNNMTKLYCNVELFDGIVVLHIDSRLFWGFEGANDGIQMVKNGTVHFSQSNVLDSMFNIISAQNFYKPDFRLNFSISVNIIKHLKLTAFFQNLLGSNNNHRYTYEAGNKTTNFFLRTSIVDEPLMVGIRLKTEF